MTLVDNTHTVTADMSRCRRCGTCEIVCPNRVFRWQGGEIEDLAPGRCIRCGHCVAVCPEGALHHSALKDHLFKRIDPFFELPFDTLEKFFTSRRSCRRFKNRPLRSKTVDALISVARLAPTATNSQNVRFIVLDKKSSIDGLERMIAKYYLKLRRQLRNPISRLFISMAVGKRTVQAYRFHLAAITDRFQAILDGTESLFYHAPVVVLSYSSGLPHIALANCNLAVMEILLAAETLRLGTCYNGYALTAMIRDRRVRETAGIPKDYTPGAAIAIGEPDVAFHRAPPRRPPRITRFEP